MENFLRNEFHLKAVLAKKIGRHFPGGEYEKNSKDNKKI